MNSETKQCQNCKKDFVIEADDFAFYEKIKVPPPTFCPECRRQRRMAFYNMFKLYKRKCDFCQKELILAHSADSPYKVYCAKCWWSDDWDPFSYGRDYDFSRPFFDQFNEFWHQVPQLGLDADYATLENSDYTNQVGHLKNCYLIFFDATNLFRCNRCAGTRGNVTESLNCFFLRDSDNCQDCFASANLRNKKYYIFNKPYTKETYFEEIKKWDLGSYATYQKIKEEAQKHWQTLPPRPKYDDFSTDSTGNYVFQSKNCKECFDVEGGEDSKFLLLVSNPPIKDCYDVSSWGNNM